MRPLSFSCEGAACVATLHPADGRDAIVIVSGGRDTRAGAHRWQLRLAEALASAGHPVLRYDRRGVGDSAGPHTGFRDGSPDLVAAVATLRGEAPSVRRVFGIGNCDGATQLAQFGGKAGLAGIVLLNPWLVPDHDDLPPPAAIRARYKSRLTDTAAWRRLLTGGIDPVRALRGLVRASRSAAPPLATEIAQSLVAGAPPARIILSAGDATALACAALLRTRAFAAVRNCVPVETIATASHSFSRPGDEDALLAAVCRAIDGLAQAAAAERS